MKKAKAGSRLGGLYTVLGILASAGGILLMFTLCVKRMSAYLDDVSRKNMF